MTGEEAALAVIETLESLRIPYMLVGSFASNFYGIPRATNDADFVVPLSCMTDRCFPKVISIDARPAAHHPAPRDNASACPLDRGQWPRSRLSGVGHRAWSSGRGLLDRDWRR
jgi:hypothetical protein